MQLRAKWNLISLLAYWAFTVTGQTTTVGQSVLSDEPPELTIGQFTPHPQAVLHTTNLTHARFPVVDVHSHFGLRLKHDRQQLAGFVELMDRNQIAVCVSLDGLLGDQLVQHTEYLWAQHRERFVIFVHLDWQGRGGKDDPASWDCNQSDFARRTVIQLEAAHQRGISGLKVFKSLGLQYRQADGKLIAVDDPRFDPIWSACGRLGLPVLIHTADPSAFFEPLTPSNERYEELSRHPDWHFPPDRFPSRAELHAARERLFERHRQTTFIAAHFGNDAEDLSETARILESHPNVVVDFASRISELGRQPYSAREFFLKYADRILFATDGPWPEQRYHYYWRFLETRDEYFPYSEKEIPPQGLWRIYGIYLPDQVLEQIYHQNAARIIPGVAERLAAWQARHAAEKP